MSEPASVADVLHAAVGSLAGEDRPGQLAMAHAVEAAMASGQHLLVQAGTGTGKSLGYLVPSLLHHDRVVVATATLALQHQLVERDIPALVEAASETLGEVPTYAVLKGRSNYACLHRVRDGVPDDQGTLVDVPAGTMGAEVLKLRTWAEEESTAGGPGDRDSAPSHADRVWAQVSVSHRECLGAAKCPYAVECFAERARERAMGSQLIVTNHSLLAIDAIEGVPMIPEYDVVVVDEAHELSTRVTQAATDELSMPGIERAAKRARNFVEDSAPSDLSDAADALREAMDELEPGRIDEAPPALAAGLELVRSAAREAFSGFPKETSGGEGDAARQQARGMVDEVRKVAERMVAAGEQDVLWLAERDRSRGGNQLCVAPLQVWGPLRGRLFAEKTVILTSATLKLGGDFNALAGSIGLKPSERVDHSIDVPDEPLAATESATGLVAAGSAAARSPDEGPTAEPAGPDAPDEGPTAEPAGPDAPDEGPTAEPAGPDAPDEAVESARGLRRSAPEVDPDELVLPWRGIDVGSPFDYPRQAILYVVRELPPPGRDGLGQPQLDEIQGLLEAANGRTLGLFSSRRAAEAAAEAMREAVPHLPVLCQGDGQLSHLRAEFVHNPAVSLFGTLSLWQGLDVPGDTCQLVLIDRIPFPRPDDPLMSARARAAERAGGNGFMAVSATHAALLLAQGAGRLIRTTADRGVVAVLDPRLATARYGSFLRASLPSMWQTYDREVAHAALRRLSSAKPPARAASA